MRMCWERPRPASRRNSTSWTRRSGEIVQELKRAEPLRLDADRHLCQAWPVADRCTKRRNIGNGQPRRALGASEAFDISDDGSLIWLADPSLTAAWSSQAQPAGQPAALGIQEIFAGAVAARQVRQSAEDPRTPDIILKVDTGVIFTGGTKIAEHGGFNEDDIHTALLVSMQGMQPAVVKAATTNQQVAPTILAALGLDPQSLAAVRREQIGVLPFLFPGAR